MPLPENMTKTSTGAHDDHIISHGHVRCVHMLNWQIFFSILPKEAAVTAAAPHGTAARSTLDLEVCRPATVQSARL